MRNNPIFTSLIDEVLNRSISEMVGTDFVSNVPAANIIDQEDGYQIVIAAPGLDKGDFIINVLDKKLSIKVEKETPQIEGTIKRKEFDFSNFARHFSLDDSIDTQRISASYDNGVLIIQLVKKEEAKAKGPMHIEVA